MKKLVKYSLLDPVIRVPPGVNTNQKGFWLVTVWVRAIDEEGNEFLDETELKATKPCLLSSMITRTHVAIDKALDEQDNVIDAGFNAWKRR